MIKSIYSVSFFVVILLIIASCSGTRPGLFTKKTPHDAYLSALQSAGLTNTGLAKRWEQAAASSLSQPVNISIPYKEVGYFEPDKPRAMGYLVKARRGEQLIVQITTQPVSGFLLFVELWGKDIGKAPRLLITADTAQRSITYTVQTDGEYIVRVQPELLQGVSYTLSVTTRPSLAFPLRKNDKPRIISVWGVDRDAGSRKHEGIDILVKKRTPAVAAASGYISSVSENKLGGKVVFLHPEGMNIELYYAHLDTQWVQTGQRVNTGDTLGLTGNTGNAKNTVSHLHFGVYTNTGAINPLPFVDMDRPLPPPVKADTNLITRYVRVQQESGISVNSVGRVIAAADNRFLLELPDTRRLFVTSKQVTVKQKETQSLTAATPLLDRPDSLTAVQTIIPAGTTVSILGAFNNYYFVFWNNFSGWIKEAPIRLKNL